MHTHAGDSCERGRRTPRVDASWNPESVDSERTPPLETDPVEDRSMLG